MSITDHACFDAFKAQNTANIGFSLASSLYDKRQTIILSGDLGTGKTTFVQGLARGLGIKQTITSPTYALEHQYGCILSHIDLYRLNQKQASEFLMTLDPFSGVRIVEWPERTPIPDATIKIDIKEVRSARRIRIECSDVHIPTDNNVLRWIEETMLPNHIVHHMRAVADTTDKIAESLIKQGRFIRSKALRTAALTHDLLRFVDFACLTGDKYFTPSKKQSERWGKLKRKYGTPHESAAEKFLEEKSFGTIGKIVSLHKGYREDSTSLAMTIEQKALAYADKRVAFYAPVTLDERFDDLMKRYGNGKESSHAKAWRAEMKSIELDLFPSGVPF